MIQLLENHLPVVMSDGLATNKPVAFGSSQVITSASASAFVVGANGSTNPALKVDASTSSSATGIAITSKAEASGVQIAAISSGTNEKIAIDAKGSGTVDIGRVSTGGIRFGTSGTNISQFGNLNVTGASTQNITAGANGGTNPVFQVDSATASVATGVKITGAASGAGVAVAAISSGANENIKIDGKGTGNVVLQSATAIPAAGSAQAAVLLGSTAAFGIYFGSGAPTVSAAQGSIYLRSDGSSTSTRMYVNTNGTTGWTAVTTAT